MSKMLVYVEDRILQSVEIALHFDDHSVERTEAKVGEQLAIRYLYKKNIIDVQGRVVDIFVNRFKQTTIKLDVSTQYRSLIIFVSTDNIRGILPIEPDSFIKLIESLEPKPTPTPGGEGGVIGDGYVDTIEEIVEQLTWDQ